MGWEIPPSDIDCSLLTAIGKDPKLACGGKKTEDGWTYFETPLDEDNEFWLGPKDAKVTVVKFADFQCAYCRYLAMTMAPVHKKYKDRVRFVMKNFPMNVKCNPRMAGYDKHPNACESAYAGRCAGLQGKFWEMHDQMYANQEALDEASLAKYAKSLELDEAKFAACMKAPETAARTPSCRPSRARRPMSCRSFCRRLPRYRT